MKSNQTILLGIVAALGVVAAVLWGTKPATPPAKAATTAPKAAAKHEEAPVAPPAPITGTELPPPRAAQLPINPTQTGELPPMREARAFYGIVDTPEQLAKLLDETVKATGGETLQKPLMAAKWKVMASMPARAVFLELQTDIDGGIYIRDTTSHAEWFLVREECRARRDHIVSDCNIEQEEFVHGLYLGTVAVMPYRLKQLTIPMESVVDTRDFVFIELPTPAERAAVRVRISRDNGTVTQAAWNTVLVAPERNRVEDDWSTPKAWTIDASPVVVKEAVGKKPEKRDMRTPTWQAAVRVTEVKPNKDKALIKLPAVTAPEPLSIGSRPKMTALILPRATRAKPDDLKNVVVKALNFEGRLDFVPYEAFAPADHVPNLTEGMAIWVTLPPQTIVPEDEKLQVRQMEEEPRIARKVIRCIWNEVPNELVKFITEVQAAGHHIGAGPTMARYIRIDDSNEGLVELQVPLKAK